MDSKYPKILASWRQNATKKGHTRTIILGVAAVIVVAIIIAGIILGQSTILPTDVKMGDSYEKVKGNLEAAEAEGTVTELDFYDGQPAMDIYTELYGHDYWVSYSFDSDNKLVKVRCGHKYTDKDYESLDPMDIAGKITEDVGTEYTRHDDILYWDCADCTIAMDEEAELIEYNAK